MPARKAWTRTTTGTSQAKPACASRAYRSIDHLMDSPQGDGTAAGDARPSRRYLIDGPSSGQVLRSGARRQVSTATAARWGQGVPSAPDGHEHDHSSDWVAAESSTRRVSSSTTSAT